MYDKRDSMDTKIDQLTRAYAEFIDIAAHDLDAPLRKLSVLIDRVTTQKNEEDQQPYITRIQHCLADMRSIIDGLSHLSHTITQPLHLKECDPEGMLTALKQELQQKNPAKKIEITSDGLPHIEGDESQLCLLLRHLLENAVVFNKNETVKIQVTHSVNKDGLIKISLKDNGIGINPEDAEKIFNPFVRLHGKSEFQGKGLGLAICKKVVENHKGTIYAEPTEGEGSLFVLNLPSKQN